MSQAGPIDVIGGNPSIPTDFVTDDGTAIPIANVIEILGNVVAAGTDPVETTASGNTININIQVSQAIAASDITKVGLSNFNSAEFTVDANGFVSLAGGGLAIDSVGTQTGTNPITPTVGGLITINGAVVAAGTHPIRSDGTGPNTMAIEVQISQALAASDATKIGLANFNSGQFSVDANGFVSIIGGGAAIESINLDTGTSPIVPSSGAITLTGATVAAGTNPIRTNGTGANTASIQIQRSQALAATDATKIGLANFDSAAFDVDANGFVQLNGGGIASTAFDVQANTAPGTDPVLPSAAGVVIVNGAAVANHSVVLESRSRAANAFNLEVQYATSAAASDATKSGVAHFDSSTFTVDSNGFVTLLGGGEAIDSFIPDSGTNPVVPAASGAVTMAGSGSTTTVGSLNTLTFQLTGLTNHAVLVGAGTTTITKVGPTATAGQVLQSAGSSADPAFSTATYPLTTTVSQILFSSATNTVTGLSTANKAVLTTGATGIPVLTPIATNGTFIIGSTAGAPASGTITSTGGTITVTQGSNTINIDLAGGTLAVDSFSPDSGTDPVVPTAAGLVNDKGSGSITTVGSLNTITTQLTGLTNHAVLVGAGTATITKIAATATTGQIFQNNASADPSWSTATYPSTTSINQILYSSATNVVSGLATANNGVLTTGTSGIPVITALASNGQLIIGSGSGAPAAATLTAGTGITITNAANSITIAASGAGFTWSDTSGTVTAVAENGYFITGTTTSTLPASPNEGDTVRYIVDTASILTIQAAGTQKIRVGNTLSAATGTTVNTQQGDAIELIYRTTGTTWFAGNSPVGAWTTA